MKNLFFIFFLLFLPVFVFANGASKNSAEMSEQELKDQLLFEESLKQIMPFTKEQIQELKKWSDERAKALAPSQAKLKSKTIQVSLEPGQAPIKVKTAANVATALVFHDATGSPWPISSITNGGPTFFQILRPEIEDKNLLNILPLKSYGAATLVVTLEGKDIPLVLSLYSGSIKSKFRTADGLILVRVKSHGPKANIPVVKTINPTVSSEMIAFLDRVPPAQARRIRISDENITIWQFNNLYYVRTNYDLMFPGWTAVVHGAGKIKCYELSSLPSLIVSDKGNLRSIPVEVEIKK